jgi:molybdopterin molybdotransferase
MKGFASRSTVEAAWRWIDERTGPLSAERVTLDDAHDRVLARDVVSRTDVPLFDRAMMDGYAVRACDTSGATEYNRIPLRVTGQALPGLASGESVLPGCAIRIMTGAPLPQGADSVLPVERTQIELDTLFALGEVSPHKHVSHRGEDIAAGSVILRAGRRLRPQDVGLLSSIGVGQPDVVRRVRVRIIVTGNELLPRGSVPVGFQIADANGPMLSALVKRDGGIVVNDSIVADQPDAILAAMNDDVDVVIVSGGSSVGQEDHAPTLLAKHGNLAIHGVAMRPSSPAGMGELGARQVFLVPGNPVSCLCAYDFFAGRAIRTMAGLPPDWPYPRVRLPLARKIVSQVGRVDYARVFMIEGKVEPISIGGASVLSSTTRADGFVVISEESEGFAAASEVDVFRY